jgi:hypothetical protein
MNNVWTVTRISYESCGTIEVEFTYCDNISIKKTFIIEIGDGFIGEIIKGV